MSIGNIGRPVLAALFAAAFSVAASAQGLSHWPDGAFHDGFDGVVSGPTNDADAARFLAQATFGPTSDDIAHLRSIGYSAWFSEQFARNTSTETQYLDWVLTTFPDDYLSDDTRLEIWTINSVGTPDPSRSGYPNNAATDELRQRVAMALSEIFVVSNSNGTLAYEPWALASFYDRIAADAFVNYRTLLEDVTKHPAMGIFLSMIQNQKADTDENIHPDENYAREVNQLFSIGLNQLNIDGTPVLVGGQPVPTYDQTTVRGFAAVFTGWDWNNTGCGDNTYTCCVYDEDIGEDTYFWCGPSNYNDPPWQMPMQPIEHYHDNTSDKQLLVYPGEALPGGVLVHGGDAQTELTAALDNIFDHPNVGPFIATRLIQRLVTSNPTPAYVQRVAQAFNNNGAGVRGDLKAVRHGHPARSRSALRPVAAPRRVRQAARALAEDHADVARDGRALDRRPHRHAEPVATDRGADRAGAAAFADRVQLLQAELCAAGRSSGPRPGRPRIPDPQRHADHRNAELSVPRDLLRLHRQHRLLRERRSRDDADG